MDKFKCNGCERRQIPENEIILTINSDGEEVLHCPKCYSTELFFEEYVKSSHPSPHSLETYYGLDIDFN